MKKTAIFALAAVCALAACKKDGDNTGGDSTAVVTDTAMAAPAPVTAPVTPTDTTMAPMTDSTTGATGGMTDTTAMDTTKKM